MVRRRKRRRVRKARRPWRVTCESGCLSTFTYREHAVQRAKDLVAAGKLDVVSVKNRDESSVLEVRLGSSERIDAPSLFGEQG